MLPATHGWQLICQLYYHMNKLNVQQVTHTSKERQMASAPQLMRLIQAYKLMVVDSDILREINK